jgi:transketolase
MAAKSPRSAPTHPSSAAEAAIARVAFGVRRRVLEHTLRHNGGYLSQACSAAEALAALYLAVMRLGPSEGPLLPPPFVGVPGRGAETPWSGGVYNGPRAPELDRFVFSPVHYALVLYSVLIELGRLAPDALDAFNRDGSTMEMIGAEHSPGHEVTAGSLGQALSQAAGIALGRRLKGETGRVWVFMSDGELQEGQTWEAVSAASHHELGNLGVYVDVNAQQCDGAMSSVMQVEPLAKRLRAFGALVREVDGHDITALVAAARPWPAKRPLFVLARTDPCRGLPVLRRRAPRLHYIRFANVEERQELESALRSLDASGPEAHPKRSTRGRADAR